MGISHAKFYQIYGSSSAFFKNIFEYSLEQNNPVCQCQNLINFIYHDLIFLVYHETAFRNLLFISRRYQPRRDDYLLTASYQRLFQASQLIPQLNFCETASLKIIPLQIYVEYAVSTCLTWIEQGNMKDNLQPLTKILLLGRWLFEKPVF